MDAETAEVRGLLKDLERFGSEITALALAPVTAQLKTVNDEFQQTYATRQEKAVERKLPALAEVRPQTDAVFATVCRYIEASYLFATPDEDRALIERLVDRMNQESEHFKTTHKQSVVQKNAAPKKSNRIILLISASVVLCCGIAGAFSCSPERHRQFAYRVCCGSAKMDGMPNSIKRQKLFLNCQFLQIVE